MQVHARTHTHKFPSTGIKEFWNRQRWRKHLWDRRETSREAHKPTRRRALRRQDRKHNKNDMQWNIQIQYIAKKAYKGEIYPLVVDRTYYNEEKNYCAKEETPKNTEQWRTKVKQKTPIHRGKKEVPSSNSKRKNELLETTLHHNHTKQPLEWSLQTRSRENKRDFNSNHAN